LGQSPETRVAGTAFAAISLTMGRQEQKTMRYIFILLVASVLSILAFKHANNSLGGGELMASPMDVTEVH
jgi:hypothetical protein